MPVFTIVKQEQQFGCIPACMATILGTDYWTVADCFRENFDDTGISAKQAVDFLSAFGFDIVMKYPEYYGNGYELINKRLLVPFADIHIVSIMHYLEDKTAHGLIMTENGELYCPTDQQLYNGKFMLINAVAGLWYPSPIRPINIPQLKQETRRKTDVVHDSASSNSDSTTLRHILPNH